MRSNDKAAFQSRGMVGYFLLKNATKIRAQAVKAVCGGVLPQFLIGIIDKPLVSKFICLQLFNLGRCNL